MAEPHLRIRIASPEKPALIEMRELMEQPAPQAVEVSVFQQVHEVRAIEVGNRTIGRRIIRGLSITEAEPPASKVIGVKRLKQLSIRRGQLVGRNTCAQLAHVRVVKSKLCFAASYSRMTYRGATGIAKRIGAGLATNRRHELRGSRSRRRQQQYDCDQDLHRHSGAVSSRIQSPRPPPCR